MLCCITRRSAAVRMHIVCQAKAVKLCCFVFGRLGCDSREELEVGTVLYCEACTYIVLLCWHARVCLRYLGKYISPTPVLHPLMRLSLFQLQPITINQ